LIEQGRTPDQELPALGKPLHDKSLILEGRKPNTQGEIHPFLDHVDATIGG
jgi:hypothetical protein